MSLILNPRRLQLARHRVRTCAALEQLVAQAGTPGEARRRRARCRPSCRGCAGSLSLPAPPPVRRAAPSTTAAATTAALMVFRSAGASSSLTVGVSLPASVSFGVSLAGTTFFAGRSSSCLSASALRGPRQVRARTTPALRRCIDVLRRVRLLWNGRNTDNRAGDRRVADEEAIVEGVPGGTYRCRTSIRRRRRPVP